MAPLPVTLPFASNAWVIAYSGAWSLLATSFRTSPAFASLPGLPLAESIYTPSIDGSQGSENDLDFNRFQVGHVDAFIDIHRYHGLVDSERCVIRYLIQHLDEHLGVFFFTG
jgi:hypothetical protein